MAPAVAQSTPPPMLRAAVPPEIRPGLAIVLDTSAGAAAPLATPAPYDPHTDYGARLDAGRRCDAQRIYWRRGPGAAPDCAVAPSIAADAADAMQGLRCEAALAALPHTGVFISSRLVQWDAGAAGGLWGAPAAGREGALECREDRGRHGAANGAWYASDGATAWTSDARREIDWDAPPLGDVHLLYSGNYLNHLRAAPVATESRFGAVLASRLAAALQATASLEVALLRLSHDGGGGDADAEGGMVVAPWAAGETSGAVTAAITAMAAPGGAAPLAEATTEALRVASGAAVDFGLASHAAPDTPMPSVAESRDPRDGTRYRNPYTHACRGLSVAILASGPASADAGAAAHAANLPGLGALECGEQCLPALAARLRTTDLRPDLPEPQRPQLLIASPAAGATMYAAVVRAAGTGWLDLGRADSLFETFAAALQHDAAVLPEVALTPPALLPRAALAREGVAFVGLTRPEARLRPSGNLRRYGLAATDAGNGSPVLVDRAGDAAFAADGQSLVTGGWSEWSAAPDGADPLQGGAAALLPPPALRRLYSDLAGDDLTAADNRLAPDDARPGLDAPRDEAPRVIRYDDAVTRVLFFTRTGRLHSIDAATGIEAWSFLPAPLLATTGAPDENLPTTNPAGALGAEPRLHRHDANGDGLIRREDGDHVWLLFGLGDAVAYYALDLTEADIPRRLWRRDAAELPGLRDTRTRGALARLRIDGARQNGGRWVVLLTSGHDRLLDGPVPQPDRGAPHLYLLDAASGELLWHAAGDATGGPDLRIDGFENGLRAPPRLVDLDGDGQLDRAYAVDVLGRVWRLDFSTGAPRTSLTRASLFATLGASDATAHDAAALRFHQQPDVARVAGDAARAFLAVSLGSGNSARPRSRDVEDRIYSLRDRAVLPDGEAPATPLRERDLVDITDGDAAVGAGAAGWLFRLNAHGAGEKTAAATLTLDHRLLFTTWQPAGVDPARPCHPPAGRARLHDRALIDGVARHFVREAADDRVEDTTLELADPRWPDRVRIAWPAGDSSCDGTGCGAGAFGLVGSEAVPLLLDLSPRRVTWRDIGIDAASR